MYVFDIISQEDVVFELYRWLYLIKTKSVHYRALKKSITVSKFCNTILHIIQIWVRKRP